MADQLASGAVRSLLGLLREEAEQLIRVGADVRFIQEEMESMESFLEHLADMTPDGGEHEPPVRTWMKQVRDLAFDCSNCVDRYVRRGHGAARGDPDGGLMGFLRSMPCSLSFFTALLAQRDAAAKIRKLKTQVLEVSERRQRYGVELPKIDAFAGDAANDKYGAAPPSIEKAVSDDDDTIRANLGFSEPNILQDCTKQLVEWLIHVAAAASRSPPPLSLPQVDHEIIAIAPPIPPPPVDHEVTNTEEPTSPPLPPIDHEVINITEAPFPPVDNVIGIVAPDKDEDGHDLVRNVFEDSKVRREGQAKLYDKVIWLPMPFGESLDLLRFYMQTNPGEALWVVLRFILNHLVPLPPELGKDEVFARDTWDMAQIAEEITNRKDLKGARVLFVISCWSGMGEYWHLMEKALGRFGCAEGSAVIVIMRARDDSNELIIKGRKNSRQIITYSLVEHFSEKVQLLVGTLYTRDDYLVSNVRYILHEIQHRCEPRAFCMKMFVHYLYGNHRNEEQLRGELLGKTLAVIPINSDVDVAAQIRETNGKRLLNFCYADLPRSFQSCLLYLAIFPPGRKIWRSRLVMRWIVEGLIAGKDMRRAGLRAERCFDTLVNRWFLCPQDIGDWGKVKSCIVPHKLVQELIQDGAKEEQFLDPRLSSHLAQHFSVHGDLQLRRSDNIETFMLQLGKKSYKSSAYSQAQLNLIKVLDLEGIQANADLKKNQSLYLKNVCNNLLLLKYLSIRNTNIERLPKKINNLEHLEILDIRQTRVSSDATKYIMLPKLKCLLAGHTHTSNDGVTTATGEDDKSFPSVQIPRNISMMPNMEVLSHVNASKDTVDVIGKLWRLRKLGVVIDDDLGKWLKAIGDLNECLLSLSILINCRADNQMQDQLHVELLQRLSIRGITSGQLLPLFLKGDNGRHIARLTLRDTLLQQSFLNEHFKKNTLSSLKCLKLKNWSYRESKLTLKKNMVPKLEFLIVKCGKIKSINFHVEATPRLEKIVWSFTEIESLTGTKNLTSLKEIELNGNGIPVPDKVREEVAQHSNARLVIR